MFVNMLKRTLLKKLLKITNNLQSIVKKINKIMTIIENLLFIYKLISVMISLFNQQNLNKVEITMLKEKEKTIRRNKTNQLKEIYLQHV